MKYSTLSKEVNVCDIQFGIYIKIPCIYYRLRSRDIMYLVASVHLSVTALLAEPFNLQVD